MTTTLLPELIPLICSYLSKRDIGELMKVSTKWYVLLAPMYYQEVVIHDRLQDFIELLDGSHGDKISNYIQKIKFYDIYRRKQTLRKKEFCKIFSRLPALQTLYVMDDTLQKHVVGVSVSHLKQIQEISFYLPNVAPRWPHTSDVAGKLHLQVNAKFEKYITTLDLFTLSEIRSMTRKYDGVLPMLTRYEKLKHLAIYNDPGNEVENLTPLLNALPELESLRYITLYDWEINESDPTIYANMKDLELEIRDITSSQANYIMQHMPNLHSLRIELIHFIDCLTSFDQTTRDNFTQFMKNMEHRVEIRDFSWYPTRHLHQFPYVPVLWDFIRAFHTPNLRCNLHLHFSLLHSKRHHFIMRRENGTLDINGRWLLDIMDPAWVGHVSFLTFKTVTVINNSKELEETFSSSFLPTLLKLLLKQKLCPIFIKNCKQKLEFDTSKDKMLQLYSFGDPPVFNLDQYARSIKRRGKQRKCYYGFMRDMPLRTELLQTLEKLYPDVYELVLEHCPLEKENNYNNHYFIDLSGFGKLCSLIMDFDAILRTQRLIRQLYIKFLGEDAPLVYAYKDDALIPYDEQTDGPISKLAYVIKIQHKQLEEFTLKRHGYTMEVEVIKRKYCV